MGTENCVNCVAAESRVTEVFADSIALAQRTAALSSLSTLAFACVGDDGRYRVCYKGVVTRYGVLPRYEGAALDAP